MAYFQNVKQEFVDNGLFNPKVMDIEPKTLIYQVPGGMLSNLLKQLKDANKENLFKEVLEEIPRVRKEMGYPPLVTPMSQMVGTQAVMNVISGERYKMVPKEIKDYVGGLYGQAPAPLDSDIVKIVNGDNTIITARPADLLAPQLDQFRKELKDLAMSEEDVLSYGLFPAVALPFLKKKHDPFYDVVEQIVEVIL